MRSLQAASRPWDGWVGGWLDGPQRGSPAAGKGGGKSKASWSESEPSVTKGGDLPGGTHSAACAELQHPFWVHKILASGRTQCTGAED